MMFKSIQSKLAIVDSKFLSFTSGVLCYSDLTGLFLLTSTNHTWERYNIQLGK